MMGKKIKDLVEMRSFMKACAKLGKSPKETFSEMQEVYGDQNLSYRSVSRWLRKFKSGVKDISDKAHSGRPKTACTKENISKIKKLVNDDGRLTVIQIAKVVGLSMGAVHFILRKKLGLKKICARWIPHLLSKEQKVTRVKTAKSLLKIYDNCNERRLADIVTGDETWVYYFEPQRKLSNKVWLTKNGKRPEIAKRCQSTKKVLYSIFFNSSGIVAQIPIPKGQGVTGKVYKHVVLKKVKKFYQKKRPKSGIRGIRLLHDNAPAHRSKLVTEFLDKECVVVLPHPPYSPDLSPCDFYLFPKLKKHLSGRRYRSRSSLGSAIYQFLNSISKKEYASVFRKWIQRLKKCVAVKGEYFEGMKLKKHK